ncbi:hypothetical protein M758_UG305400 [Ceratodon purpureus]|nr:hypothetical protein M758_UG305400 [Ceratodon purpureus]
MGRNLLKTYGLLRRSEFRNYEGACNAHSLGWNILGLTIALTFFLCNALWNRFRGCHCAKSNCCSRQCPCFAAGRECDPDVCRNCWVGCGDGTFEGPPPRGDSSACLNMKLMLKQQQRVLLGKSDVAGWGAFLKVFNFAPFNILYQIGTSSE